MGSGVGCRIGLSEVGDGFLQVNQASRGVGEAGFAGDLGSGRFFSVIAFFCSPSGGGVGRYGRTLLSQTRFPI